MTDDHDSCEWVNVSSGTGSSPDKTHRAVKRLCVCVCANKKCAIQKYLYKHVALSDYHIHEQVFLCNLQPHLACNGNCNETAYSILQNEHECPQQKYHWKNVAISNQFLDGFVDILYIRLEIHLAW